MTSIFRSALLAAVTCACASAAQFQFSTLIRLGSATAGAGNWELAAGNSPGTWAATGQLTPAFSATTDRLFQIDYNRGSNSATLRVYSDATTSGTSDSVTFNPAGGPGDTVNTVWTLPASSFFIQSAPELSFTTVTVSNLALVTGTIISPLQTTPMSESQIAGLGAGTVTHSGDVVFTGDGSGNWRLQGIVSMSAIGLPSNDGLTFGITASAADAAVPEPMTSVLIGAGLLWMATRRRQSGRTKA